MEKNKYQSFGELLNDLIDGKADGILDPSAETNDIIPAEYFSGAVLKGLEDQSDDFWKLLLEYLNNEDSSLGHFGVREEDFPKDIESLVEFINNNADLTDDYLKNLIKKGAENHWNESLGYWVNYFLENIKVSQIKEGDIEYNEDGTVKETHGKILNGTENLKFRIKDLINANAGNSFKDGEWVVPWWNIDGDTYKLVRGLDAIEPVLNADNQLQFTNNKKLVNKYISLIMPKYKRRFEVEDLNRNFWVIAQVISALIAYLFDDDSPIPKMLGGILDEIVQLWENVAYLWAAMGLISQEPIYKDIQTIFMPITNSELQSYIKFDNFANCNTNTEESIILLRAAWNKLEYLIKQYDKSNLVIIPEIRDNNYKHNYYSKVSYPGIITYSRNSKGRVNYYIFSSNSSIEHTVKTYPWPDVNGDGVVDAADANLVLQYYTQLSTEDGSTEWFEDWQHKVLSEAYGYDEIYTGWNAVHASDILSFCNDETRIEYTGDQDKGCTPEGWYIKKKIDREKEQGAMEDRLPKYYEIEETFIRDGIMSIDLADNNEPLQKLLKGIIKDDFNYYLSDNFINANQIYIRQNGAYYGIIRTISIITASLDENNFVQIDSITLQFQDVANTILNNGNSILEQWTWNKDEDSILNREEYFNLPLIITRNENNFLKEEEIKQALNQGFYLGEVVSYIKNYDAHPPITIAANAREVIWTPDKDQYSNVKQLNDAINQAKYFNDNGNWSKQYEAVKRKIEENLEKNQINYGEFMLLKLGFKTNHNVDTTTFECYPLLTLVYRNNSNEIETIHYDIEVENNGDLLLYSPGIKYPWSSSEPYAPNSSNYSNPCRNYFGYYLGNGILQTDSETGKQYFTETGKIGYPAIGSNNNKPIFGTFKASKLNTKVDKNGNILLDDFYLVVVDRIYCESNTEDKIAYYYKCKVNNSTKKINCQFISGSPSNDKIKNNRIITGYKEMIVSYFDIQNFIE